MAAAALRLIGRGIGFAIKIIFRPFVWAGRWYARRGWTLKIVLGAMLLAIIGLYGYFFWNTQRWANFNPDYVAAYRSEAQRQARSTAIQAARPEASIIGTSEATRHQVKAAQTCRRSLIVDATADLVDFNVNQNAWISSMLASKMGFFGIPWEHALPRQQGGVPARHQPGDATHHHRAGRFAGPRARHVAIDPNLQKTHRARLFEEEAWYVALSPSALRRRRPPLPRGDRERSAFNDRLEKCHAMFDARGDNLPSFVDRIANDIGSTSEILRDRSENVQQRLVRPARR